MIALFDADHVFHSRAHDWWSANAGPGWASCPLTENGLVRIMSHPGYSKKVRLSPGDLISRLARFAAATDHVLWPDDVTLRDQSVFNARRLHSSRQVTDIYLTGLASRHGGRLATFDDTVDIAAVPNANPQTVCVIP